MPIFTSMRNMTCELSPYSCMPNTMSQGAMANVQGRYPDLLYAPIEIKGDAEVHALSRCQMILTEAKKRAQSEFVEAMAKTGMTIEKIREIEEKRPEVKKATYPIPHSATRPRPRIMCSISPDTKLCDGLNLRIDLHNPAVVKIEPPEAILWRH